MHCSKGTAILLNCFPGSCACRRRANAIYWYFKVTAFAYPTHNDIGRKRDF